MIPGAHNQYSSSATIFSRAFSLPYHHRQHTRMTTGAYCTSSTVASPFFFVAIVLYLGIVHDAGEHRSRARLLVHQQEGGQRRYGSLQLERALEQTTMPDKRGGGR